MGNYYLMNKNKKLMMFEITFNENKGDYDFDEIERYASDEELPPKFGRIKTWVNGRNYAKHKEHLQKWLKEWQIDNPIGFIEVTHGLSLNDSIWIKKVDSELVWEKVNLYSNDFNDVVSKTAFDRGLKGLKLSTTSPEFTSEGSFEKCWIREEDGIYLYKKSSSGFANAGLEAYSEYYATQFSSALCHDYVPYDLVKFKGNLVSRCKMFTNENEGFVPIYKYLDANEVYDIYDIVSFLEPYGFADDFRDMIVLDAVIFNPDRHFGNFGFIVDNDTNKVLRFAPVFDHNMAMLSRAMKEDLVPDSPYIAQMGHRINGDFIPVARAIATDSMKSKLKELKDVELKLHEKYNLPKERTDFLEEAVRGQIRGILGIA